MKEMRFQTEYGIKKGAVITIIPAGKRPSEVYERSYLTTFSDDPVNADTWIVEESFCKFHYRVSSKDIL